MTLRVLTSLSATQQAAIRAAAADVGASAALSRSGAVPMRRLLRNGAVVQSAPAGYHYTMALTVVPFDAAAATMSWRVYETLAKGQLILSQSSAALRGAKSGDVAELQTTTGGYVSVTIGLVAPDDEVRGAEFVAAPATADALGATRVGRMILWAPRSRAALEEAIIARNLINAEIIIGRSWDPPSPDSVLGSAANKIVNGEFTYRLTSGGGVVLDPGWVAGHISGGGTKSRFLSVPIVAACNNAARPNLQHALTEIAAAGLASAIDVANANRYGGCWYPRFVRGSPSSFGSVSRHSWGSALDTNTVQNPLGGVPTMNCDVVRIFRRWGFAWGGNFTRPDGMHFEYVGERRDLIQYPSKYCPNLPASAARKASAGAPPPAPGGTPLFADDGFAADPHE